MLYFTGFTLACNNKIESLSQLSQCYSHNTLNYNVHFRGVDGGTCVYIQGLCKAVPIIGSSTMPDKTKPNQTDFFIYRLSTYYRNISKRTLTI